MLQADDVVVALSYSGETDELLRLMETIKRLGARLIALTGATVLHPGEAADVALDCRVSKKRARSTSFRRPAPPPRWRSATPWR